MYNDGYNSNPFDYNNHIGLLGSKRDRATSNPFDCNANIVCANNNHISLLGSMRALAISNPCYCNNNIAYADNNPIGLIGSKRDHATSNSFDCNDSSACLPKDGSNGHNDNGLYIDGSTHNNRLYNIGGLHSSKHTATKERMDQTTTMGTNPNPGPRAMVLSV